MIITKDIAQKVIDLIDQGLVKGIGNPTLGQMCVEAAVCFALGLPHGDDPVCVSRALRALKIRLNDANWSSNQARAEGLRRLAVAQLESRDNLDDNEFKICVAKLAITLSVPVALRAAASINKNPEHKQALLDAANICEKEGTKESAINANSVAKKVRKETTVVAAYAADAALNASAATADASAAADAALNAFAATAYAADATAYARDNI